MNRCCWHLPILDIDQPNYYLQCWAFIVNTKDFCKEVKLYSLRLFFPSVTFEINSRFCSWWRNDSTFRYSDRIVIIFFLNTEQLERKINILKAPVQACCLLYCDSKIGKVSPSFWTLRFTASFYFKDQEGVPFITSWNALYVLRLRSVQNFRSLKMGCRIYQFCCCTLQTGVKIISVFQMVDTAFNY